MPLSAGDLFTAFLLDLLISAAVLQALAFSNDQQWRDHVYAGRKIFDFAMSPALLALLPPFEAKSYAFLENL